MHGEGSLISVDQFGSKTRKDDVRGQALPMDAAVPLSALSSPAAAAPFSMCQPVPALQGLILPKSPRHIPASASHWPQRLPGG